MREIEIEFDTYYDEWQLNISNVLNEHDIIYKAELPMIICRSLKNTIYNKLRDWGYKPRDTLEYREQLVKKLKRKGLRLQIKSNKILWKYLEYFTDIEDYSLCFDISMIIEDFEKASDSIIFLNIINEDKNGFELKTNLNESNNKSIQESLNSLKLYKNKYPFMLDLINIIENILERS